jgi:hypothetical protein
VTQTRARRANPPATPQAMPRRKGLRRLPQQHQHTRFRWRYVSLVLLLVLAAIAIFVGNSDVFVVTRAEVGWESGPHNVPIEEIYSESGTAGKHILSIDPIQVQQKLELSPSIESAQVMLNWPAVVIIRVREREPALIWEQQGKRYWVDLNGHLMVERRVMETLLHIVNEGDEIPFQCPGPNCQEQDAITINPEVVRGAQHLKTLRTNIDVLYYDPVRGLSYQDGRGWRAYFGLGATMDTRLIVYETLVASLELRGIRPLYIDVSNPDAPYYRVAQ